MSLYETLGVGPDATPDEIKAGHRRAVKKAHPDAGGSPDAFHRVQRALVVLSDPRARAQYDRDGTVDEPEPEGLLHAQARSLVAQKMNAMIADPQINPATFDLVLGIRELLNVDANGIAENIKGIRGHQKRLREFAKRLKRKKGLKGEDRLVKLIEGQIDQGNTMIAHFERDLQTAAAAKEIVAEYVYETEAPQFVHMGNIRPNVGFYSYE